MLSWPKWPSRLENFAVAIDDRKAVEIIRKAPRRWRPKLPPCCRSHMLLGPPLAAAFFLSTTIPKDHSRETRQWGRPALMRATSIPLGPTLTIRQNNRPQTRPGLATQVRLGCLRKYFAH